MAKLNIISEPDSILRTQSKEVTVFGARLHQLLDDLADTMKAAGGIGIAAVQVGILYNACLVSTENMGIVELVNPVIIKTAGRKVGDEGCLSVPNRRGFVVRPTRITVRAQDRHGEFKAYEFAGREAVCACHELDHLKGILFVDKLEE